MTLLGSGLNEQRVKAQYMKADITIHFDDGRIETYNVLLSQMSWGSDGSWSYPADWIKVEGRIIQAQGKVVPPKEVTPGSATSKDLLKALGQ